MLTRPIWYTHARKKKKIHREKSTKRVLGGNTDKDIAIFCFMITFVCS